MNEMDFGMIKFCISFGRSQSSLTNIQCEQPCFLKFFEKRDGQDSTSSAYIKYLQALLAFVFIDNQMHQFFCFRPGNKYIFIDQKCTAIKVCSANDML